MADKQPDLLEQFKEFLEAKAQSDKENADAEDHEVEIWDKDGRGARVKRSVAKPFLQSLGIDMDTEEEPEGTEGDDKGGKKPAKTTGKQSGSQAASGGVARRYFINPNKK